MTAQAIPTETEIYTVDDFFALIPEGQKADLIDGVIYVASPDTPRHNLVAGLIQVVLDGYASAHGLGTVFVSRVAFELTRIDSPEPDVAFVAVEHLDRVEEGKVIGPPDVAVEVVSRWSKSRDYGAKLRQYEAAGVREYWLIDGRARSATFYRLRDGRFVAAELERGHIFRSEVAPGFWLDVRWLFANPLPDKFECLKQVLAGDPVE
jgi:Uma2 family endonuclease